MTEMSDIAISVKNVGKRYQVFDTQRRRLLHAFFPARTKGLQEIWALKDVSFEIRRGEAVAIIGRNGGGKSTLLEILTGTLTPTTGSVTVNGRVNALLELGSGFNPEYTGRDNVILNGLLLGLSREDILSRFDEIADFAEIGPAIDRPVKTYSSGMMMRLAFAVQVMTDPDILIIDEALSVGDFFFQQKCMSYMRKLREKGVTLLFVSHDMSTVRDLCDLGLVLEKGVMTFWGDNLTAVRMFLADRTAVRVASPEKAPTERSVALNVPVLDAPIWSPDKLVYSGILGVEVCYPNGDATTSITMGQELVFRMLYKDIPQAYQVSLAFRNRYDQLVSSVGTINLPNTVGGPRSSEFNIAEFRVKMDIEAGEYSFRMALGQQSGKSSLDVAHETPWIGPIQVKWAYESDTPPFFGMFGLPTVISII